MRFSSCPPRVMAPADIPEPGDQLGDGGLAGAGRPSKAVMVPAGMVRDTSWRTSLVRVIAKGHMGEANVPPLKLYRGCPRDPAPHRSKSHPLGLQ